MLQIIAIFIQCHNYNIAYCTRDVKCANVAIIMSTLQRVNVI